MNTETSESIPEHGCLFVGTVDELASRLDDDPECYGFRARFLELWGCAPSDGESRSWSASLGPLCRAAAGAELGDRFIAIEFPMMNGFGRCDAVIFGSEGSRTVAHVVELKQWSFESITLPEADRPSVEVSGRRLAHPSYQCANYVGKIRAFHSLAHRFDTQGSVFLHNLSPREVEESVGDARFSRLLTLAPVFGGRSGVEFVEHLRARCGSRPATLPEVLAFLTGTFRAAPDLIDMITAAAGEISANVLEATLGRGWGLTDDQLSIEEGCLALIRSRSRRVVLVRGGPGSGKTLVAVRLLLRAVAAGRSAALATHNAHLRTVLGAVFEQGRNHGDGFLWSIKKLRQTAPIFDVVICDESQRFVDDDAARVISKAPLVILFYDERQRLLWKENGSQVALAAAAAAAGRKRIEHTLVGNHRSGGGAPFDAWLDQLFVDPVESSPREMPRFENDFDIRSFSSASDMHAALERRRSGGHAVCLAASFTESDGVEEKVRYADPLVEWAMKSEYIGFWRGGSSQLEQCSSVYGCQSFERDYIGIFWGKDLCLRNVAWAIPPDHTIKDNIGSPTIPNLYFERGRRKEAIQLLFVRYRIFLTRGKRGAYLFIEDRETRETLHDMFPWLSR